MKRIKMAGILLSLCLAAGLCVISASAANGQVVEKEAGYSLIYTISGREATLTGYTGSPTSLSIPETVTDADGYRCTVTAIGYRAFWNCATLQSIGVPGTVTVLETAAFEGCSQLSSVSLSEGVQTIDGAFYSCSNLWGITLPNSVTSMRGTFLNCRSLYSVNIPRGVTELYDTFRGCENLTSITIPSNVTSIQQGAFSGCGLISVTVPNSVTVLGGAADSTGVFQNCKDLQSVTLPYGLQSIGGCAFAGCTSLQSVTIPNSVTTVSSRGAYGIFESCASLEYADLGSGIREIPQRMFYGCGSLKNVTIPNSVRKIGHFAFANCTSLTNMTIPSSVAELGGIVFEGCTNLDRVTFERTTAPATSSGDFLGPSATIIYIPSGATGYDTQFWKNNLVLHVGDPLPSSYSAIQASPANLDFGNVEAGYSTPASKQVTITNTGRIDQTLQLPTSQYYTFSLSSRSLPAGGSAILTVTPKTGLNAGAYYETVTIPTASGASTTLRLSFAVTGTGVSAISVSPTSLNFGRAKEGYTLPDAQTVTITNSGTISVSLGTPAAKYFIVSPLSTSTLTGGQSASFTVQPKAGLQAGNYSEMITVSTSSGSSVTVTAAFLVSWEGMAVSPSTLNFGSAAEGYTPATVQTVVIRNTGTEAITLRQPASYYYDIGTLSRASLPVNATASFTISPKAGLGAGTYQEMIAIQTGSGVSESISASFTVNPKNGGTPSGGEPGQFSDVPDTAWYSAPVAYVSAKGLMSGVGGGRFDPDGITTRGQIVTILYRIEGEPPASGGSFLDVAADDWYANAIQWAAANGVVAGYDNGCFGPNDFITREQLTAILYRYAQRKGYPVNASADLSTYPDASRVSSYAEPAMRWAVGCGMMGARSAGFLDPSGNVTRCELAAVLMHFCENTMK